MTDRLEELLALMDDGDEEEREDETAPAGQLPVLPLERSREARDAGEIPGEEFAPEDAADGEARGGVESVSAEEQVWPILDGNGSGLEAVRRPERPGDAPPEEGTAPREGQRDAEMARAVRRGDERGLEGLYRRAAQAVRPASCPWSGRGGPSGGRSRGGLRRSPWRSWTGRCAGTAGDTTGE